MPHDLFPDGASRLTAKAIHRAFPAKTAKRLGQNFLFDAKINGKIVWAAGNLAGKIIAEVGPGPGGLTLEILKQDLKKLFVIERDPHWANVWRELRRESNRSSVINFDRLEVIEADALRFDFGEVSPEIIISNLPYNISTQLLFKWLREFDRYEQLVLMFQKEVADRICAAPGSKAYGKLSVLSQWKAKVSKLFDLAPGSFFPPPKIKSTVLQFFPMKKCSGQKAEDTKNLEKAGNLGNGGNLGSIGDLGNADQLDQFSDFLSAVFMHRRKIISSSLKTFFPNPHKILEDLGYGPNTRAEQISGEDFFKMFTQMTAICNRGRRLA
jgi:16S rRNA (adenine1518-N6/adenine1519-N6)-dimethyltransferase